MFELLKKKFSDFVEKISKKEIEKPQTEEEKKEIETIAEKEEPTEKTETLIDHEEKTETPIETKKEPEKEKIIEKTTFQKIETTAETSRELKTEVSITSAIKSIFSSQVELTEKDLESFLEELELSLLEADVEQNTAEKICEEIKKNFVGKKFAKKDLNDFLKTEIKKILKNLMQTEKIDFLKKVSEKKPFVVLMLGPNGAGKTTTIAKLASFLQKNNKTVLLAAADTFRAASIEQLEKHASNLNVKVIKQNYGSDPTAVAFDSVSAAKAKGIDVVLIDSAGRQETNKNLLGELQKIVRVIKPDLKLYVGESYSGQALLQQASEFDKQLNLDGFILTKLDVDPKGGTTISLLYNLKKPILFIGTGQEYFHLEEFNLEKILEKIIG